VLICRAAGCAAGGGVVFADKVTTVSPTYAQEVYRPEFGFGMQVRPALLLLLLLLLLFMAGCNALVSGHTMAYSSAGRLHVLGFGRCRRFGGCSSCHIVPYSALPHLQCNCCSASNRWYCHTILDPPAHFSHAACFTQSVLGRHAHKFSGVLNGIDQHMWSPGDDPLLPPWGHYSPNDTRGKVVCKTSLLGELGMPYTDPAKAEGASIWKALPHTAARSDAACSDVCVVKV
jgi:hypothetical protein